MPARRMQCRDAALTLLVLIVSAFGMASATGINIQERTREIGVMRAIGATPRMIFQQFVAEGMIVSVASIALGLLLAWPLSRLAAVFFGRLMLGEGAALRLAISREGLAIVLGTTLLPTTPKTASTRNSIREKSN